MQANPLDKTGRDIKAEIPAQPASLPLPGSNAYGDLSQFVKHGVLPFRRTIRRQDLQQIVPLAETTIYEMERRGEFPRRFNLTPRYVKYRGFRYLKCLTLPALAKQHSLPLHYQ